MGSYGSSVVLKVSNGSLYVSLRPYGLLCFLIGLMRPYVSIWVFMRPYAFLWVLIGLYAS